MFEIGTWDAARVWARERAKNKSLFAKQSKIFGEKKRYLQNKARYLEKKIKIFGKKSRYLQKKSRYLQQKKIKVFEEKKSLLLERNSWLVDWKFYYVMIAKSSHTIFLSTTWLSWYLKGMLPRRAVLTHLCPPFQHVLFERLRLTA